MQCRNEVVVFFSGLVVQQGFTLQQFSEEFSVDRASICSVRRLESPFVAYDSALTAAVSMALAARVMRGGRSERDDYLAMLKSDPMLGPVTILSRGGVDLTSLSWIDEIMNSFDPHIDTLDRYLRTHAPGSKGR